MAVAISRTADPAGASASSFVATYSSQSIGTAAEDRIIVLSVVTELASSGPTAATINYGSGVVSMTAQASTGNFGAVYARHFYALAPTGTTADFTVTFGSTSPSNVQNHVIVHRVVGAAFPPASQGGDGSTDMDATDPLTTGSVTIATGGGFLGIAGGATDTVAKTWANATEDLDADGGNLRYTNAWRTTSGTVTVTVTGGTNGEDGALAWLIFTPGTFVLANAGSFTFTGTAADLEYGREVTADAGSYGYVGADAARAYGISAPAGSYAFTGTDATLTYVPIKKITADAGSYAFTGTDASLEFGREIAADSGAYSYTGTDAALEYGREVLAGAGSYSFSGVDASLEHGWKIAADSGSFLFNGTDASLELGREVTADAGGYLFTGVDADLLYASEKTLAADAGAYSWSGTDASLEYGREVSADSGLFGYSGTDATLTYTPAAADAELVRKSLIWGIPQWGRTGRYEDPAAEKPKPATTKQKRKAATRALIDILGVVGNSPLTEIERDAATAAAQAALAAQNLRADREELERLIAIRFAQMAIAEDRRRKQNDAITLLLLAA